MLKVIGMISGTSFDAIEALAVELELDGERLTADLLAHSSTPYPEELRAALAVMLPPAATTLEQVCRADAAIGQHFALAAEETATAAFGEPADVIASHGQTVFHWVVGSRAMNTLQLGQAAFIAELTGSTVVHDLRVRDIAAGGQGAPLASLIDVLLLADGAAHVRGVLNLGGIANVTIIAPGRAPIAFDTGPANALIDAAISWRTQGRETYDRDGVTAARGTVDEPLFRALMAEPYYQLTPPKSTGKELFHLEYLRRHIGDREIATGDLLATLTAVSAQTVATALGGYGVTEVVAAGGGTRNPALMDAIAQRMPRARIVTTDTYGVAEAAKEALAMAVIGFLTVHGLPGVVASCTGARRAVVLGSIVPGLKPLTLSAGARSPSRLVVRTPLFATTASERA